MRLKYSQSKRTPRLVLFRLSDLLIFSFGAIVLLVIANIVWVLPILKNVEVSAYSLLGSRAHNTADKINRFVENELEELTNAALLINRGLEDPENVLRRLLRENRAFDALILLDNEGKEVSVQQIRFLSGSGVLSDNLFQVTRQNQVYISELLFNRIAQPTIEYGIPLQQTSGFTALVGQTNLKFLIDKIFEDLEVKQGDAVYIVDRNGYLIGHTDWNLVAEKTNVIDRKLVAKALAGQIVDTRDKDNIYVNEKGDEVFATAIPLKLTQWALIVEEAENPTLVSARQTLSVAAVSFGFQILLILLLLFVYFRLTRAAWLFFAERNQREAIMNNLVDGVIEYDNDLRILLMNPQAENLLGVTFKEISDIAISPSILEKKPHFQALVEVMHPVLAPHASASQKIPGSKARKMTISTSQPKRTLEVTMTRVVDENGKLVGFLKILHDIKREVLLERIKAEFVSIAAHQLRTPLSAMKWTMRLLLDGDYGKIPQVQRDVLERTYESNERMITLVDDLLNVARIEEGRFMYKPVFADLSNIIQSVVLETKKQHRDKKVRIMFVKPNDKLPKIRVDVASIKLALQNICDNAVLYTESVATIIITAVSSNKQITISVQDTGMGISEEERPRIFTKFFRSPRAFRLAPNQSGLGLFIVKNIIEAHGGKIWFESKVDKGTIFYFTLPVRKEK